MWIFFLSNIVFVFLQQESNNHVEKNDCFIKKERLEELNEKRGSTKNKKKIDSRNNKTESTDKAIMVAFHPNDDRPKRVRKAPDRLTY